MTNPTARETPDFRDEPTTLREMLEFVADWAHECAEGDEPDNFYGFAEIEGQCRLALATPEPAPLRAALEQIADDSPDDSEDRWVTSARLRDIANAALAATPEPAPCRCEHPFSDHRTPGTECAVIGCDCEPYEPAPTEGERDG